MDSIRCEIFCQKGKRYAAKFAPGPAGHTEDAFSVQETAAATLFVVREQGPLGWLADQSPRRVTVNAVDCTDLVRQDGALYTLPLPEGCGRTVVQLEWSPAGK